MHILVYDICDNARLHSVAKIIERYMNRVQKSVFEGDLSVSDKTIMMSELSDIIDHDMDYIILYTVPINTIKAKYEIGNPPKTIFILP